RLAAPLCDTWAPLRLSSSISVSLIQMACAAENQGPTSPHASITSTVDLPNILKVDTPWYFASLTWVCIARSCSRAMSRHAIMNFAGAVMRDRRRDAEPQPVARVRPSRGEPAQRGDGCVGTAHAHLAGAVARIVGPRVGQAGHRLVEGEIGTQGRDHRAQPDLGIGVRHRLHALDARRRKLEEQVVAGGRALLDMFDGIDERREVLVLVGAAAADPRRGIEEGIGVPEIADALGQAAMAGGGCG